MDAGTSCDYATRRGPPAPRSSRRAEAARSISTGPTVVDTACAAALELAVANYRFVRRYVERHPAPPLTLRQVDPLIRELTHYRDVIAQKTQETIPT